MGVPKKRRSNSKTNMRRAHHAFTTLSLSTCSYCEAKTLPHRVCGKCGRYRGRLVLEIRDSV